VNSLRFAKEASGGKGIIGEFAKIYLMLF